MQTEGSTSTHRRLFVTNSVASLVRAASTSSLAVLVPLLLAKMLPSADYSAWVLAMGIASYVLNFDLGLQSSIQSIVARFSGQGDHAAAARAGSNSVRIVSAVGVIALGVITGVGMAAPLIFGKMDPASLDTFKAVLLLLTVGQISALISNVMSAYFMGYHEGLTPTLFIGGSRIATLLCVVGVASLRLNVLAVAGAFCIPQVIGAGAFFLRLHTRLRHRRSSANFTSTRARLRSTKAKAILRYSAPLAVWALCMLVINGAGVTIVGIFSYSALPTYSIAMMLAQIAVGLQAAIASPLLAEFSRRTGSGQSISALTQSACRLNSIFVLGICSFLTAIVPILELWLPRSVTSELTPVTAALLIFAFGIRLLSSPVSTHIVASDGHSKVILPPVMEAIFNVFLAYLFGYFWGLTGVILGIFAASLIGTGLTYRLSIRLAGLTDLFSTISFRRLVLFPLMIFTPFGIAAWSLDRAVGSPFVESILMLLLAGASILALATFHYGRGVFKPVQLFRR